MKTTIELPDSLFRQAKATAAAQGISLKQLFTEAVTERLRRDTQAGAEAPWKALLGGLAPLRRETRRIQQRIDEEFGVIDEADE